jgi:AcrR family transcriptional regulator
MGKRQESRLRIEQDIIEVGRRHLVTDGAAGLSLRAIARDLGMVSSAVYRYVASRDELLTLLIVDAYTDLADAVQAAGSACSGDWRGRLLTMAHAARQWAVAQPASWALMYGSPVPGYHAPANVTMEPGTRLVVALFGEVAAGVAAGDVAESGPASTAATSRDFDQLRTEFGFPGGDATMLKCFLLWAALVGAISLEVFGQYGADTLADPADVFDGQLRLVVAALTN